MIYRICKAFRELLTASISLRAFHCSYGTPRCSAVWMVRKSWLVQTFRPSCCCSSTNWARAAENYSRGRKRIQSLKLINCHVKSLVISFFRLRLLIPVGPAARGLRHRPAAPPGCRCSPHDDTGRWSGAGHGCSSGSRRSYSGRGPGYDWQGNAAPRLSPWWRRDPWVKILNEMQWAKIELVLVIDRCSD